MPGLAVVPAGGGGDEMLRLTPSGSAAAGAAFTVEACETELLPVPAAFGGVADAGDAAFAVSDADERGRSLRLTKACSSCCRLDG